MANRTKKIGQDIKRYVLQRKRRNSDLSCRALAVDASNNFKINISKSSINSIIKASKLSSPVGRSTERVFRPDVETSGAGYAFLFGACLLTGISKLVSSTVKSANPLLRLKDDTLDAITEAWIMARAIYNVPLERMEDYRKNEMWFLVGRKVSKGLLKRYIDAFKMSQTIKNNIVMELMHMLQDVRYMRFTLADNSQYILDGQLKSIWRNETTPIDFCTTIDVATSYVNKVFFGNEPMVIFNSRPESILGEEISDFIFSIDGSFSGQRIRRIELVSHNSNVIKEIPFIVPARRSFILGIWPWQYKAIAELEKKAAVGKVSVGPSQADFYYSSTAVKFVQHTHNIEVMLRLIVIKQTADGPAKIALFTNLDENEWSTKKVVQRYLRNWPDPETGHKLFLSATKNPRFLEEFISGEKIFNIAKKISNENDVDGIFACLVDVLNEISKRFFFPAECSGWSLLKMRELFYKKQGRIKRDLSGDILYNMFDTNMLEYKDLLISAITRFNEFSVTDFSGRKFWILPAHQS